MASSKHESASRPGPFSDSSLRHVARKHNKRTIGPSNGHGSERARAAFRLPLRPAASALLDPPRPFTRLCLLSSAPLHSSRRGRARRPRTTKRPSGRLHVANGRTSGDCDHQLRPAPGAVQGAARSAARGPAGR